MPSLPPRRQKETFAFIFYSLGFLITLHGGPSFSYPLALYLSLNLVFQLHQFFPGCVTSVVGLAKNSEPRTLAQEEFFFSKVKVHSKRRIELAAQKASLAS